MSRITAVGSHARHADGSGRRDRGPMPRSAAGRGWAPPGRGLDARPDPGRASRIAVACGWALGLVAAAAGIAGAQPAGGFDYLVLATTRTSTMEREMNEAAAEGYRFQAVMGGDTQFGSAELVTVMVRDPAPARRTYRVLATSRTSRMQEELQEAGDAGFDYRGQTVYESAFGGREIIIILERDDAAPAARYEYQLLATNRTSTMQEELGDAGRRGFELLGLTVGETGFGGLELVVITRRPAAR